MPLFQRITKPLSSFHAQAARSNYLFTRACVCLRVRCAAEVSAEENEDDDIEDSDVGSSDAEWTSNSDDNGVSDGALSGDEKDCLL
jgi:hypothetical protein